jgi:hypothetical protein
MHASERTNREPQGYGHKARWQNGEQGWQRIFQRKPI